MCVYDSFFTDLLHFCDTPFIGLDDGCCMKTGLMMGILLAVGCLKGFGGDAIVFCGSSPCGEAIQDVLGIPRDAEAEVMQWKVTLHQGSSRYELRCEYGATVSGQPGPARNVKTFERQGTWASVKGTNPDATVYELKGALSLLQVDPNVLQVLNPEGSLMMGTSGCSYTLNRTDHSERTVDRALVLSQPDMSYQIAPLASGPTVFAVFEGRTPGQGIASDLKVAVHPGCNKVKWRVTLYQNPETLVPTSYKVEGSL